MDENASNTSYDERDLVMPTEDNDIRLFPYPNDKEVARDDLTKGLQNIMIEKETEIRSEETSEDWSRSQDKEPCNSIKQEATSIINYRFHKHFKSVKNSIHTKSRVDKISLNFVKSAVDEPEDRNNTKEHRDEESNEQPLDFSLKSRKRRNSELASVEDLDESFKVGLFENNEDTWMANFSRRVHNNEVSSEHLKCKDTKDEERNFSDFWSQSVNQDQDHIPDSDFFNNAINFQTWSRSFPGYSQAQHHALTSRFLTSSDYRERPFLGQLNSIYNAAYHADLLQRFIHNRMWMVAQAKGLPLPTIRLGLEANLDLNGKDLLSNISANVGTQHQNIFLYNPNHLYDQSDNCLSTRSKLPKFNSNCLYRFNSGDEVEKSIPKKICSSKNEIPKFILPPSKVTQFTGGDCSKANGPRKINSPKDKTILTNQEFKSRPGCLGDFICQLCNERFDNSLGLANHNCSKMAKVRYECPQCEKVFNCPANLASHRRWHRPKQP